MPHGGGISFGQIPHGHMGFEIIASVLLNTSSRVGAKVCCPVSYYSLTCHVAACMEGIEEYIDRCIIFTDDAS